MSARRVGVVGIAVALAAALAAAAIAGGGLVAIDAKVDGENGVDGLASAYGSAVSPDGKNVYAIGDGDQAVAVFKRRNNGTLAYLETHTQGVDGVANMAAPSAIGVSPDGDNVYVSTGTALVTFDRNGTGRLTYRRALVDGVGGVDGLTNTCCQLDISRDGRNVYVSATTDQAVSVFKRNKRTGRVSFLQLKKNNVGDVKWLASPEGVVVSRDGKNVYAIGYNDNSLVTFKRGRKGKLRFVNAKRDGVNGVDGLLEPCCSLAISRDGRHVIVPGEGEQAVALFKRNGRTGKLRFMRAYRVTRPGFEDMEDPIDVIFSRDGKRVFVASFSNSAVVALKRTRRGNLKALGAIDETTAGAAELDGAWRLSESPDGSSIYVSAYDDHALVALRRKR